MNLEAYQEFHRFLTAVKINTQTGNIPQLLGRDKTGKTIPENNPDEARKFLNNVEVCLDWLPKATIFEIDEDTAKLCANTKVPKNKSKYSFLPHDPMFIDFKFTEEHFQFFQKHTKIIIGMLMGERPMVYSSKNLKDLDDARELYRDEKTQKLLQKTKGDIISGKALGVYLLCVDEERNIFLESLSFNEIIDLKIIDLKLKHIKLPTSKFAEIFITNLLNFINDPEVIFVTHKRDTKNQERRTRQGKMLLPDSKVIKITGTLKIYIDEAKKTGGGWHHSFRYPVKEHDRKYRDESGSVIKTIRIKKHHRGQGITIDRTYEVTNERTGGLYD